MRRTLAAVCPPGRAPTAPAQSAAVVLRRSSCLRSASAGGRGPLNLRYGEQITLTRHLLSTAALMPAGSSLQAEEVVRGHQDREGMNYLGAPPGAEVALPAAGQGWAACHCASHGWAGAPPAAAVSGPGSRLLR